MKAGRSEDLAPARAIPRCARHRIDSVAEISFDRQAPENVVIPEGRPRLALS
jgi:hypothetical protein